MRVQDKGAREAIGCLEVLDETNRLEADVGREWRDRAAKVERDLRLLQWMAVTAIVLAATVLVRVSTH